MGDSPNIEAQLDELSDPASVAAQRWDTEHDKEVLRRVVEIVRQDVNPIHWRAFQAHVLDGKPVQLVAKELGVSDNVVLLAKSRITKKMQLEVAGLIGPS